MKVILETWNSINFLRLIKTQKKTIKIKPQHIDYAFAKFRESKQPGLHRGQDKDGYYYGWPNTGYDMPGYRVKIVK